MRDLAQVCTVSSVNKMYQKDLICWITLEENGYEYIMPNTTKVGDKVVAIGEGSILPETDRWEFLRKRCYKENLRGFLISPMTMGKKANADGSDAGERVKSWGLCVTLDEAGVDLKTKPGTDVTDLLQIRKYEPAEDASPTKTPKTPKWVKFCMKHKFTRWIGRIWFNKHKTTSGNFPSDIIEKSDETTIQNYKGVLGQFAGKKAFITAKCEGQSFTCSLDKKTKKLYVCSRNNRYDTINSASELFFRAATNYEIEKKLKAYLKKTGILLILQGEQMASSVQGNIFDLSEPKWYLFRMKGLENGKWVEYNYPKMNAVASQLGLECVPLIEVVEDMGARFKDIKSIVEYTEKLYWKPTKDGFDYHYQPKPAEKLFVDYLQWEGAVFKSEDYNKEENRGWSFKCKNLQYAEKSYSFMNELCRKLKKK